MSYLIGIDIGGSKIAAGLVKGNKVLKKASFSTPMEKKALMDTIFKAIESFSEYEVSGIGIGAAGSVDEKGNWLESPNIRCVRNIPLKKMIHKRFRKKVEVNNDANCFALGESAAGTGKKMKTVFGLILGTGTGGGIVINNRIISGRDFLAGEIGAIPFKGKHAEEFCSGRFIKRAARKHGIKPDPYLISDMALKGNRKAMRIYEEFGKNVGELLAIIICVINPDIVVVGGGVSNNFRFFRKSMISAMRNNLFFKEAHNTPVRLHKLKDYGIVGASMLIRA
ncbi:ROK family protein [Candidatus Woesearchaeota archaeon]|nr:ROK family protein [Candidatus Woesearchaeota archaeon]